MSVLQTRLASRSIYVFIYATNVDVLPAPATAPTDTEMRLKTKTTRTDTKTDTKKETRTEGADEDGYSRVCIKDKLHLHISNNYGCITPAACIKKSSVLFTQQTWMRYSRQLASKTSCNLIYARHARALLPRLASRSGCVEAWNTQQISPQFKPTAKVLCGWT